MAINKITPPTGGAPLSTSDYDAQNQLIGSLIKLSTNGQRFLTEWDTNLKPEIPGGTIIHHGGALFLADSDTAITGSPGDGEVWVKVSGTEVLTPEFITSLTGYSWDPVNNGFYNVGGDQVLPVGTIKNGTDYILKNNIDLKSSVLVSSYADGSNSFTHRKNGNFFNTSVGTYTRKDLFDFLSPSIPLIGDLTPLSGVLIDSFSSSSNTIVSSAERLSLTQIRVNGIRIYISPNYVNPPIFSPLTIASTEDVGYNVYGALSW